ncbi:MarR family transcriptional regulator [Lentzea atacamensis]|jgi:DNA-binding MarR family transcriptional regulator|uniref:MarR family transcriptional regulator n=2 Tax=Lentzea TaxID=165301 RepID=A0A316I7H5_9PSEU|nr:MarR family transcriptional regulator [Lentzea atacamensis]PWK88457.1 MarR family transcriptional regulator [Lentzea atacamensis]RAS70803.1 MarR family transcriptional regulator [Lentzea atacamensis]
MTRANEAWESLMRAYAVLMKRFNAEDVWGDLTMREYDVLYTLSKCDSPLRMSELNRHVLLSQPALSRMVDRLADRGLVDRCPDPGDRRGVRLSLTPEGRRTQREIGRPHARSVTRALNVLTPEELEQLAVITGKLAQSEEK